jgi:hypothetical protein
MCDWHLRWWPSSDDDRACEGTVQCFARNLEGRQSTFSDGYGDGGNTARCWCWIFHPFNFFFSFDFFFDYFFFNFSWVWV